MPSGAFIASPSRYYSDCWLRDHLYCTLCYYYLKDIAKLRKSFRVVFNILHRYLWKIDKAVCITPTEAYQYMHAKVNANTFKEITNNWGHHQLDVIGLFLYLSAFFEFKGIKVIRKKDINLIQLLVFYLLSVKYWERPDSGMWEEKLNLHSSSIGAALSGLYHIRKHVFVPKSMIKSGRKTFNNILPNESPDQEVNMSQLSLIWPYNIVPRKTSDIIIARVTEKLVQEHGLNRYLNDNYHRSRNGISGEWPLGFFWLSIAEFQRGNIKQAEKWLFKGLDQIRHNRISELFYNGSPNINFPLAWAHSFAIIALIKLKKFSI
ncbi:hypothetical protein AMJ47_01205 [Parcubacteria bacterium DG_72]|nr:MAG: hypothetical protein AMJ47_01205 [Parcubacteria bacterium DG_72]